MLSHVSASVPIAFEESFVVLLISLNCRSLQAERWGVVSDALTNAQHETDVVGWFERGRVLGLIRPLGELHAAEAAAGLADTTERELKRCLSDDGSPGCSLRLEVYSAGYDPIPAALDVRTRGQKARQVVRDAAKRMLDITGGAALLDTLSPVFLVVAALVKAHVERAGLFSSDPHRIRRSSVHDAQVPDDAGGRG